MIVAPPIPAASQGRRTLEGLDVLECPFEDLYRVLDLLRAHDERWNPTDGIVVGTAGQKKKIVLQTVTDDRLGASRVRPAICTRELTVAFRLANGVGSRGILKTDVQEKLNRHLEKHLPAAMAKTVSEME